MRVAARWNLPVGVVHWHGPEPLLTVVVKATFALDGPEAGSLADAQQPLFFDDVGPLGAHDEVDCPSDFAPRKARADVLLVGHAHAAAPTLQIAATMEVAGVTKAFGAYAGAPCAAIPLLSDYLSRDARGTLPVRVGARRQPDAGRGGPLGGGFDFGAFNVAPEDQQLAALPSNARMVLHGLRPGGGVRDLTLCDLRPAVFVVRAQMRGEAVPLVCDTLWINVDAGVCALVWRGTVAAPGSDAHLALSADYGAAPTWERVMAEMGAPSHRAVEDTRVPYEGTATVLHDLDASGEDGDDDGDDTAPVTPRLGAQLSAFGGAALGGVILGGAGARAPLPFDRQATPVTVPFDLPRREKRMGEETIDVDVDADLVRLAATPFAKPASEESTSVAFTPVAAPLPFVDAPPARRARDPLTTTAELSGPPEPLAPRFSGSHGAPAPVAHQLPYVGGDTVTADHVAPGLRIGAPMAPTPFVPPEAREPDAANEPDAGVLSLARYAAIKVALLRGRPIAAALGEHGLDEVTWRMEEQRRAEALAHAADNGDLAIIHQLRRAMRDAQRAADEPAD